MPTGHYAGRNIPTIETATCRTCEVVFPYKKYKCSVERQFCNQACHMKYERERRRKVPEDYDLLHDLYWNQNMTIIEIGAIFDTDHSTVKTRMRQLNIPRRRPGHSRNVVCMIIGCDNAVYKIKHKTNGSYYGRRCLLHWVEHRQKLVVDYWQNVRKQKPEFIKRETDRQERRELKKWTKLLHKTHKAIREGKRDVLLLLQQELEQVKTSQI